MGDAKTNQFVGTWKLEESENFDEYMKTIGVGFMMRKMGAVAKPDVMISVDGDTWTIKAVTSFTTNVNSFKISEQFEENTPDGRKVQTTFSWDGEKKLEQTQTGDVPSTITRELSDDGSTMTCKLESDVIQYKHSVCVAKDVSCKRVYKKA